MKMQNVLGHPSASKMETYENYGMICTNNPSKGAPASHNGTLLKFRKSPLLCLAMNHYGSAACVVCPSPHSATN